MFQHLTTQQAAAAIVDLINRSPRSPRPDEIEAIVARVTPEPPARRRGSEAQNYVRMHKWWGDPLVDENDDAELDRRHDEVQREQLRIVRAGIDIEALAAITVSIAQETEIDFDNPEPVDHEPQPGQWAQWAGHALAVAVLRQWSGGPLTHLSDDAVAAPAQRSSVASSVAVREFMALEKACLRACLRASETEQLDQPLAEEPEFKARADFALKVWDGAPAMTWDDVLVRALLCNSYGDLGTDALNDAEWLRSRSHSERAVHEFIIAALRIGGVLEEMVETGL